MPIPLAPKPNKIWYNVLLGKPGKSGEVNVCTSQRRCLDKSEFQTLCSLDWIRNHHSLVITGPTGTGKLWLASALANQACRQGLSCHFIRVPIVMESLVAARGTANFNQKLAALKKLDLLILDDWGIEVFNNRSQNDLLELIDNDAPSCSPGRCCINRCAAGGFDRDQLLGRR